MSCVRSYAQINNNLFVYLIWINSNILISNYCYVYFPDYQRENYDLETSFDRGKLYEAELNLYRVAQKEWNTYDQ